VATTTADGPRLRRYKRSDMIERTVGWLGRGCRLSKGKDYERTPGVE
jgi:hypothetical protein